MISFYILSKRLFLKRKILSNARIALITEKEYDFVVHFFNKDLFFIKIDKDFKVNI